MPNPLPDQRARVERPETGIVWVCLLCPWWEGDANLADEVPVCNGWPEAASHDLMPMRAVEVSLRPQGKHWFCPTHGLTCSQSRGSDGIWRCAPGGHNLVGYVPSADHRGAVDALDEAIKAARLFNRNGMTWLEYDHKLVELEQIVYHARGRYADNATPDEQSAKED